MLNRHEVVSYVANGRPLTLYYWWSPLMSRVAVKSPRLIRQVDTTEDGDGQDTCSVVQYLRGLTVECANWYCIEPDV